MKFLAQIKQIKQPYRITALNEEGETVPMPADQKNNMNEKYITVRWRGVKKMKVRRLA